MKRFRIFYKDNFIDDNVRTMIIRAETEQDAYNFFFDNHGGFFLRAEFIGWAQKVGDLLNPMFDAWLRKNKGISSEDLKQKSEEERMACWKEYKEHRDYQAGEYNRQLYPHHYEQADNNKNILITTFFCVIMRGEYVVIKKGRSELWQLKVIMGGLVSSNMMTRNFRQQMKNEVL